MSDLLHDSHIIRTWHDIAVDALNNRATDIHIEARSQETIVRIRVDGLLTLQNQYPIDLHERLITRIKILARLDIAEKRLPQDGRLVIGHDFSRPNIDCRVSILPTLHCEKAVVRILPSRLEELALDQIGLLPEQLKIVQDAIGQTNGLILVTGPTGSGKTRTLYSCLSALNQVQRNICSVEDPIEIRLPGVNQVAYHPKAGLDFPTIIRALLRQDPDVIMIGEIRDPASAQLAIQAAQTGHLVLSTLHTRNAIGALGRLKSLGIDQESIESCLRCVSSQRLIRKRCKQCNSITRKTHCNLCKGSGYFGRIGVHEVLGGKQLFQSIEALDIYSAGIQLLKSGLIDQMSLDSELGTWH
ncbi:MAG: type II secretion system protein E [Polynucleobacter sp. 24-46-87]|uniref:GspE/PulE family protein n=1 Tax=unclassified Polynucleobacter TaxID=2640945 RepID=UPI000BD7F5EB|nr:MULTISPECIES: GspE/PulE family protein [unclassified Polynucleobacter]OYY21236.1 MAG: type II secretion system protein E [Polynucleobacter sp. 35-46-11]OZA15854.1 MAG: type II secretion system protein E [Polynucleobacter sp. 24-46-87]OZA77572.1 MAG: type II secretion system protein E [Polynucleobacter sp. 39-46-10]